MLKKQVGLPSTSPINDHWPHFRLFWIQVQGGLSWVVGYWQSVLGLRLGARGKTKKRSLWWRHHSCVQQRVAEDLVKCDWLSSGLPYWRFSCQIAQIWRFFKAFGMKILVWHFGIFLAFFFQSGNSVTHLHLEIER